MNTLENLSSESEFFTVLSVVPVVLKNVNPFSSKSFDSSEPKVLNKTLISEDDFLQIQKETLIDVGFSKPIPLVKYYFGHHLVLLMR